jgi:hypothetical protein
MGFLSHYIRIIIIIAVIYFRVIDDPFKLHTERQAIYLEKMALKLKLHALDHASDLMTLTDKQPKVEERIEVTDCREVKNVCRQLWNIRKYHEKNDVLQRKLLNLYTLWWDDWLLFNCNSNHERKQ